MKILLVILIVVTVVAYSRNKGYGKRSPSAYKNTVKKILKRHEKQAVDGTEIIGEIKSLAADAEIQKYFRKIYGKMCDFSKEELVLESYFLLVFGDMRTHYLYKKKADNNRYIAKYEDYYTGNKNYNMVVTERYIYFGDDLNQKKGKRPIKIPLSKIEKIERTTDYIEFTIKSPLKGERIHNIWSSSGEDPYYLLSYLCGFEKNLIQEPLK